MIANEKHHNWMPTAYQVHDMDSIRKLKTFAKLLLSST